MSGNHTVKFGKGTAIFLVIIFSFLWYMENKYEEKEPKKENIVEVKKITPADLLISYKEKITNKDSLAWMPYQELKKNFPESEEMKIAKEIHEAEIKRLEEERLAIEAEKRKDIEKGKKAIKKLKARYDKVEKITWYTSSNLENGPIEVYIGVRDGGQTWMCYRIKYDSFCWVFWDKFKIYIDGDVRDFLPSNRPKRESLGGGEIVEYINGVFDSSVFSALLESAILDVIQSKDALVRFSGDKHYDDKKITSKMKTSMQLVFDAYKMLKAQ